MVINIIGESMERVNNEPEFTIHVISRITMTNLGLRGLVG